MEVDLVSALILIAVAVYGFSKLSSKQDNQKEVIVVDYVKTGFSKAKKVINQHKKQLAIQRAKSVFIDSYGKENTSKWFNVEIPYFYENHILPVLDYNEQSYLYLYMLDIQNHIEKVALKNHNPINEFNSKMDGFEFELFCADKLKKEGWVVSKTKSGADQGIDLIIEKGKRKIGVQCKKYAKPVGNKAVQEVKAGLDFYKIDEGIVLGSSSFTKSAIALANSNNIKLLHYLETKTI